MCLSASMCVFLCWQCKLIVLMNNAKPKHLCWLPVLNFRHKVPIYYWFPVCSRSISFYVYLSPSNSLSFSLSLSKNSGTPIKIIISTQANHFIFLLALSLASSLLSVSLFDSPQLKSKSKDIISFCKFSNRYWFDGLIVLITNIRSKEVFNPKNGTHHSPI